MKVRDLYKESIQTLEELGDPKRVEFAQKTYPTKLRVLGVTMPNLRLLIRELKPSFMSLNSSDRLALIHQLVHSQILEAHQVGLELAGCSKTFITEIRDDDILALHVFIDNWVLADTYAVQVLGFAWRLGVIKDYQIHKLAYKPDVWERRAALASTVALNKKSVKPSFPADKTLQVCSILVDDHHDMIVKAMSWALRTLTNHHPVSVQQFLTEHQERLHTRIKRETLNKIETGLKNGSKD